MPIFKEDDQEKWVKTLTRNIQTFTRQLGSGFWYSLLMHFSRSIAKGMGWVLGLWLIAGSVPRAAEDFPRSDTKVSFNFAGQKAIVVFEWFEKQFGILVTRPTELNKETLTLRSESPLGIDQTYEMLLAALESKNHYAILDRTQRILEIVPFDRLDKRKLRWMDPSSDFSRDSSEIVNVRIPVTQGNSGAVRGYLLRQLTLPEWVKIENPTGETIEVTANFKLAKDLVEKVKAADKSLTTPVQGVSGRIFPLKFLKARHAFQMLVDLLNLKEGEGQAKPEVKPKSQTGEYLAGPAIPPGFGMSKEEDKQLRAAVGSMGPIDYQLYLNEDLNAIHAVAPPTMLLTVEQFIQQIDIEPSSLPHTQLYTLNYVDVSSAIDMLFNLFQSIYEKKGQEKFQSPTGNPMGGGTFNPMAYQNPNPQAGQGGAGNQPLLGSPPPPSVPTEGTVAKDIPGKISFIGNRATNHLMVLGHKSDLDIVEDAIRKMDKISTQVLIEISAMEVALTGDWQFGVAYHLKNQVITAQQTGSDPIGVEGKHLEPFTDFPAAVEELGNTSLVLFSGNKLDALLKFLQKNTKISIISVPKIIAQNNKEAVIKIQDVNYWTKTTRTQRSGTTVGTTVEDIIREPQEYTTGMDLTVTPKINEKNQVFLTVQLELSEVAGSPAETGFPPPIARRAARVSAMVPQGDTIFLGGIVKTRKEKIELKTPILSAIPVIGPLFSSTVEADAQRELVLFLTPHVLQGSADLQQLFETQRAKHKNVDWPSKE